MKKLVIISQFELAQNLLDYYRMDELSRSFDLEFWDCSKCLKPNNPPAIKIERDYVHIINSIKDLKNNLIRIPKDSLINYWGHFNRRNYGFLNVLSLYFPKLIWIDFLATPQQAFFDPAIAHGTIQKTNTSSDTTNENINGSIIKRLKKSIYKNKLARIVIKSIFHPSEAHILFYMHYKEKCLSLFEWYYVSCIKGVSKYYINHPDIDKYYASKVERKFSNIRYIVYIEQNFPYHPEIKELFPDIDIDSLAMPHFRKMNKFFDIVEKQYGCPVVIAAHPSTNYEKNPFEGRRIEYYKTEALVANSEAVIAHNSTAIGWAVLGNKPIVLIEDAEIKKCTDFYMRVQTIHQNYGINILNIDNLSMNDNLLINTLSQKEKQNFLNGKFGDIDMGNIKSNAEWIKLDFEQIYQEMCNN